MITKFLKENAVYNREGNILHFIFDDGERPYWSSVLEKELAGDDNGLKMKRRYDVQRILMNQSEGFKNFVEFASGVSGVKVDLASGPSGYFAPILDRLGDGDIFVATDACPSVVSGHAEACVKPNFFVMDVDLEKPFPFKDGTVDLMTCNLPVNVVKLKEMLIEVARCLKPGGRLAIIEVFYEHGSKTYEKLSSEGSICASLETFCEYCGGLGLRYTGGDIISEMHGKLSKGDLYPIDDNDRWCERTAYFEK